MNIAEQLADLLPSVEITEGFVSKLTSSIEAAVAQRVEEEVIKVNEQSQAYAAECLQEVEEVKQKANAYAEYVVEEMTQKVDDYAEYVVEQFIADNKQKLVETAEFNRIANTLRQIREAFESNYFTLTHEPASAKLERNLDETKAAYNQLFEQHRVLKHQVEEYDRYVETENRNAIFEELTKELAQTQIEKLTRLVETANFLTQEEYRTGVALMIEELTVVEKEPSLEPPEVPLVTEAEEVVETPEVNDRMKFYLEGL